MTIKQEIFFNEEEYNDFINDLQRNGIHYRVESDEYFDFDTTYPCMTVYYDDQR